MWWMLGIWACQAPMGPDTEPSTTGSTAETGGTETQPPWGSTDTGASAVEPCDVPLVEADGPALELSRPPKRLVVLSIDTLRRDFVDFYTCGEDEIVRMPFLTSLLAQSVSLEDVQQCSNWTYPSTNCTLSGTLLEEMDHVPRGGLDGRPVPEGQRTLAALLRDAGFATGLVFSNGWFHRLANPELTEAQQLTGNSQGYQRIRKAGGALSVVDAGVALMDELRRQPGASDRWLLHLHFIEPHDLYVAPDEFVPEVDALPSIPVNFRSRASFGSAQSTFGTLSPSRQELYREHFQLRYSGDLRQLDQRLRTVWTTLGEAGLLEDTLVAIWTDHGEAFWERGPQAHGWRLGAEENDAILAFWHPELEPVRVAGPHHAIDFLPTVLAALGRPVPADLAGVRAGLAEPDRARFTATSNIVGARFQAVTRDDVKLTVGWDGTATLHDRAIDRRELTDRFDPQDPRVGELWGLLRPRVEMLEARIPEGPRVDWAQLDERLGTPP